MSLFDYIEEDRVKIPMTATGKLAAIRELVGVLIECGDIIEKDKDAIIELLVKREEIGSTGMDNGIALPHAKSDRISNLSMAVGVCPRGLDFDSVDGKPTKILFLILSPASKGASHMRVLSNIASITRSSSFCEAVINSADASEVVDHFMDAD